MGFLEICQGDVQPRKAVVEDSEGASSEVDVDRQAYDGDEDRKQDGSRII